MPHENGHLADVRENLKDIAIDYIRERIFEQRTLRCGEQVNERELSRTLCLSRAPIREALKELEEQGLIVSVKYKGWFVADFREEDILEINRLRTLLEHNILEAVVAAGGPNDEELRLAASINAELETIVESQDIDDRKMFEFVEKEMAFHEYLCSLAKGDCFWTRKILRNFSYQIRCYLDRRLYLKSRMQSSVASHNLLLESLKKRDVAILREYLFRRMENSSRFLQKTESEKSGMRPETGGETESPERESAGARKDRM